MMQDKYSSCKFSGETYVGRIAKRCSMISLVLRPDSQTPRVETLVLVKLERHWRPKTANTAMKKARLTTSVAFWYLIPNNYCNANNYCDVYEWLVSQVQQTRQGDDNQHSISRHFSTITEVPTRPSSHEFITLFIAWSCWLNIFSSILTSS